MMNDRECLAQLRRGNRDAALKELVNRYGGMVRRVALRITRGNTHQAEDVSQGVFITLLRIASTLSGEKPLGPWLHFVAVLSARNLIQSEARRRAREALAVRPNIE